MIWDHPMCADCWYDENPGRHAATLAMPEPAPCCQCGTLTYSGIYVRRNPATVPYPAADDD
jgi:hypothetical protein